MRYKANGHLEMMYPVGNGDFQPTTGGGELQLGVKVAM